MAVLDLNKYAPLITRKDLGEEIYSALCKALDNNEVVDIEMGNIISMTTFCAKQIFGRVFVKLGREEFNKRIHMKNTSEDVQFIIRIGITNALKEAKE